MEIHGYKAFYKGLINRYGLSFEEGKTYTVDGDLQFGNEGNGFHFCKRLEDTLRYFPASEEEIDVAEVTSLGDVVEGFDDYYGYYDMYCTNKIRIDKVLSRADIISHFYHLPEHEVLRFIQGFLLTPDEIELFKILFKDNKNILNCIAYYQEKDTEVYQRAMNR